MDRSRFGYLEVVNADTASPGTNDDKLNLAFDRVEASANERQADLHPFGIVSGLSVVENGTPNMTVRVTAGVAQDQSGNRIDVPSTQSVSMETDYLGNAIALPGLGNEKYASVFVRFKRLNQEQRQDGNSLPYYQSELESFEIRVRAGSEASSGTATPPALQGSEILLADVLLTPGMTAVGTGDIELLGRRQDAYNLTPSNNTPRTIRRGRIKDVVTDLLLAVNDLATGVLFISSAGVAHDNGAETFAGSVAPPTSGTLQSWLRALVTMLGKTTATPGLALIGNVALGNWADGNSAGAAGGASTQLAGIVSALAASTGLAKIGGATITQVPDSVTGAAAQTMLASLLTLVNARARKANDETISGGYSFTKSGTGISTASGTTADFNGPVTLDNTVTATAKVTIDLPSAGVGLETAADTAADFKGPVAHTGAEATTAWRITDSADSDGTYDVSSDEYRVPNTLDAGRTYTLRSSTSPIPASGQRIRFSRTGSLLTNTVTFQREGATTIASFAAGTPAWVEFTFHDSAWRVTAWGGNTTVSAVS